MPSQTITVQPAQAHVAPFTPLTKEDVASLLKLTPRCVELWVEKGRLPRWRKIGNRCFWHPDVFYAWLDAHLKSEESPPDEESIESPALVPTKKGRGDGGPMGAENARRMARILKMAGHEVVLPGGDMA